VSIFVTGGHVQTQPDAVYVVRLADADLLKACREGSLAYILHSRQVGKSSLMIQVAKQLFEEGAAVAIVDLTSIGANLTLDQWCIGILRTLSDDLGLACDAHSWWTEHQHLGPTHRISRFFIEEILSKLPHERVVIFFDEIDTVRSLPFKGLATDDFFAAMRSLHLGRAQDRRLARLSLVFIGVATPSDLIEDPDRTPFNIGERIEILDFTAQDLMPLAAALGVPEKLTPVVTKEIFNWTGGHPYLTLKVFRGLEENRPSEWNAASIDRSIRELFLNPGAPTDSNLEFVRDMLVTRPKNSQNILQKYLTVLAKRQVADSEKDAEVSWLKLSGVVVRNTQGFLKVRNRLYRDVFGKAWVQSKLPTDYWRAELRRHVVRYLPWVAAVVFAMVGGSYALLNTSKLSVLQAEEQKARADRYQAEERAEIAKRFAMASKQEAAASTEQMTLARRQIEATLSIMSQAEAREQTAVANYLTLRSAEQGVPTGCLELDSCTSPPKAAPRHALASSHRLRYRLQPRWQDRRDR
jgi:hypothetical protein